MQLAKKKNGSLLTVALSGELDHHNAASVREELDRLIAGGITVLTLDMSGVTFMDSSGIGLMIGRYKAMARRGGSVAVKPGGRQADRLMELSGLYQILEKLA